MTNADAWSSYKDFTKAASDNARALALSGVALAWALKLQDFVFPRGAKFGLTFLVLFFLLDLFQYYVSALMLRDWVRTRELELTASTGKIDGEYLKPTSLDAPGAVLFHLKMLSLILAFVALGVSVVRR